MNNPDIDSLLVELKSILADRADIEERHAVVTKRIVAADRKIQQAVRSESLSPGDRAKLIDAISDFVAEVQRQTMKAVLSLGVDGGDPASDEADGPLLPPVGFPTLS